jgi:hypothetical protein
MHQGTIYQYNQRAEILIPERRGTTYYGPDNHKPLVCYRALNIDFDFYVKNTDRKPQSLHNKTYTCDIIDRTSLASVINKQLIPHDYDNGLLVLHLDHEETSQLDAKLYDIQITYTDQSVVAGSFGGTSDQNNRLTFVLEVRDGALRFRPSETVTAFNQEKTLYIGGRMAGPIQNSSRLGLQTAQVHTTDYTGTYKFQATVSLQPLDSDWFDVPSQSYTVSSKTGVGYHTFTGQYYWVRLIHEEDPANTGTLDKVVYRS